MRDAGVKGKEKCRVVILQNIVAPYRLPIFEGLSQIPSLSVKVFFYRESVKNRRWNVRLSYPFDYEVLPGFAINLQGQDLFTYHVNPSLITRLLREKWDLVISHGYERFADE